jgi:hypothetical protein
VIEFEIMTHTISSLSDLLSLLPTVLGIIGVLIILWYYFLLQVGKCNADGLGFSVGNFIGAVLLLISLWYNWNLPSVIIEAVWCLISLYGIIKYYTRPMIQR